MRIFKIDLLFLLGYQLVGLVPYFGAINKSGPQYLYLSILNILYVLYYLSSESKPYDLFNKSITREIKLIFLFFLISCLSIIYSISVSEAVITTCKLFIFLTSTCCITLSLLRIKSFKHYITLVLIPSLFIFLSFPYMAYSEILSVKMFEFSDANYLKTFTGNKNVLSALLSTQIFLCYLIISNYKLKRLNIILFLIFSLSGAFMLILLSSRATILGFIISILFGLILLLKVRGNLKAKYVLLFIAPVIFTLCIGSFFSKSSNISLIDRVSTITTNDTSTIERLKFYKHGIKQIIAKPFTGIGIGNWKIKSIEYDQPNLVTYRVPYHMHNDFLQYFSELGIFGGITYLLIFILPFWYLISKLSLNNYRVYLPVIMAIIAFSVDSLLNFPHDRPILMVQLSFIISIFNYIKLKDL